MNYIGSKAQLLPFLRANIEAFAGGDLSSKVFCDLFAGSGCVGKSFATDVRSLISNDQEYYSYVLNRAMLQTGILEGVDEIIASLNALPPTQGIIYKNYCEGSGSGRNYFSDRNGQKIDAMRQGIEAYKENEELYFFLLASLLLSADKVANTASVYSAFLKHLKPLAQEELCFQALDYQPMSKLHQVFCEDANTLISKLEGDILYLDPPYNRRQYGANYHLLNTIARYDSFVPKGKTGVRSYESSPYCKTTTALQALEKLIYEAKFSYIFISYNDEGIISSSMIAQMMQKYGKYESIKMPHHRFKAYQNKLHKHYIYEYLHFLEKF
ncbi:DNA adenine methylase [Sulfurospirillum oryzae]|uniref:DNA adenine methylase n=1 Tax=Sulfurospirillum oryzae TaxID=2976535 RepID=UPI0021E7637B|nr:DNA adenine methylase [Sulfurospirillum oryzae]